ncbi:MAG: transcription antitermination factor NusB [Victivallaceae bacterium]
MEHDKKGTQLHAKRLGRELAMQYLFQCDLAEADSKEPINWELFIEQAFAEHELKENRHSRKGGEYAEKLIKGVTDNQEQIDAAILGQSEKWDWERMAVVDRNIMRVAAYEMLFSADVPPVVSINEAVEIARDYSGEKAGNFINGVLNGIKGTLNRPARKAVKEL